MSNGLFAYTSAKCVLVLTVNLALLVIGLVLFLKSGTIPYGKAIQNEVLEWNLGPIVDVIAVNST